MKVNPIIPFIFPSIFLNILEFKLFSLDLDFGSVMLFLGFIYYILKNKSLDKSSIFILILGLFSFVFSTYAKLSVTRFILHFMILFISYTLVKGFVKSKPLDEIIITYFKFASFFVYFNYIVILGYYLNIEFLYDFSYLNEHYKLSQGSISGLPRFSSFFREPAHYVLAVLPLFLYSLNIVLKYGIKHTKHVLIILGVLVSQSSLIFISVFLFILLKNLKLKRLFIITPFLMLFSIGVYEINPQLKDRVDGFLNIQNISPLNPSKDINLSSFVVINNAFIAYKSIQENIFGNGLGLHQYAYDKYNLTKNINDLTINKFDASSLAIRLLSELGLLGLIIIGFILRIGFKSSNKSYLGAILFTTILIFFLRSGHYFLFGLPLFSVLLFNTSTSNFNTKMISW